MAADFVHLHLHTHYSMLDGACTAKGLVKMAKEMEMPGIAITDHGYMGGTEEFHRVLADDGRLVLAVPGPRHLFGMKEILYDTPYENEVQDTALAGFTLLEKRAVTFDLTLPSQEAIADLFAMTPYCYRTPRAGRERLAALDTLSISAEFYVLVYEKAKP